MMMLILGGMTKDILHMVVSEGNVKVTSCLFFFEFTLCLKNLNLKALWWFLLSIKGSTAKNFFLEMIADNDIA